MQKVCFWDLEHWRFRAEEARTVADQMTQEEARTIMRRIAFKVQLPHPSRRFSFCLSSRARVHIHRLRVLGRVRVHSG